MASNFTSHLLSQESSTFPQRIRTSSSCWFSQDWRTSGKCLDRIHDKKCSVCACNGHHVFEKSNHGVQATTWISRCAMSAFYDIIFVVNAYITNRLDSCATFQSLFAQSGCTLTTWFCAVVHCCTGKCLENILCTIWWKVSNYFSV